jgi:hypothetical protein
MNLANQRFHFRRRVSIAFWTLAVASGLGIALPGAPQSLHAKSARVELAGGWRLVRTPNPRGGTDAISIMRTAETLKSDLDLAGLMIRCNKGRTEVVVVLIAPLPLRARPQVVLGKPGNQMKLEASVAAPGTAVLLPESVSSLVNGQWKNLSELVVRIQQGQTSIRGVIALAGLPSAYNELLMSCAAQ